MAAAMNTAPKQDYKVFRQSLHNLFHTRNDTDDTNLNIICGGKSMKVHSFLLCIRSKFFATACKGPFKEALTKESHLQEDDLFTVYRLLLHCYMFDCSSASITISGISETTYVSELLTDVHMYSLADKYDFIDLKEEAMHNFDDHLNGKLPEIKAAEIQAVLNVIPAIYGTTPESDRGLRDPILSYAMNHWQAILDTPDVHEVVPTKFVVEVSGKLLEKSRQKPYSKPCANCQSIEKYKVSQVTCSRGHRTDF